MNRMKEIFRRSKPNWETKISNQIMIRRTHKEIRNRRSKIIIGSKRMVVIYSLMESSKGSSQYSSSQYSSSSSRNWIHWIRRIWTNWINRMMIDRVCMILIKDRKGIHCYHKWVINWVRLVNLVRVPIDIGWLETVSIWLKEK